jgi:hypothetical protein
MSLPPLPEQLCHADGNYTEAQLITYGRQCVEAAAALCEGQYHAVNSPNEYASSQWCAEAIRNMLKGED